MCDEAIEEIERGDNWILGALKGKVKGLSLKSSNIVCKSVSLWIIGVMDLPKEIVNGFYFMSFLFVFHCTFCKEETKIAKQKLDAKVHRVVIS